VQLAVSIPVSFVRYLIGSKDYYGLYKLFESKLYKGFGEIWRTDLDLKGS
jgi:hypothetical protein